MNLSGVPAAGFVDADDRAEMQRTIDAVCEELGILPEEGVRRRLIARRIVDAYRQGHRLPLNLVDAGLGTLRA